MDNRIRAPSSHNLKVYGLCFISHACEALGNRTQCGRKSSKRNITAHTSGDRTVASSLRPRCSQPREARNWTICVRAVSSFQWHRTSVLTATFRAMLDQGRLAASSSHMRIHDTGQSCTLVFHTSRSSRQCARTRAAGPSASHGRTRTALRPTQEPRRNTFPKLARKRALGVALSLGVPGCLGRSLRAWSLVMWLRWPMRPAFPCWSLPCLSCRVFPLSFFSRARTPEPCIFGPRQHHRRPSRVLSLNFSVSPSAD